MDSKNLHTIYDEMNKRITYSGTDTNAKSVYEFRSKKFIASAKWLKAFSERRADLFKTRIEEKATNKIEDFGLNEKDELVPIPQVKITLERKPLKKPEISLLNLFYRGIYLSIDDIEIEETMVVGITFRYFDIENNLTIDSLRKDVAMIFEFLAYNDLKIPFKIIVYTWDERKAKIYRDNFLVSKSNITDRLILQNSKKDTLFEEGVYFGIHYESLEISRYFNSNSPAY